MVARSLRSPAGTRSRALGSLLLLVGVALLSPVGVAQDVSATITSLTAPTPVILDATNHLDVRVRNNAPSPLTIEVTLTVVDEGGKSWTRSETGDTFMAGETRTVRFEWDGRNDAGDPFDGDLTITADAQPSPAGSSDEETINRWLAVHDLQATVIKSADGAEMDPDTRWNEALVVEIENQGNVDDAAQLDIVDATDGWTFTLSDFDLPLPLDDPSARVSVFVQAPPDAEANKRASANLTLRSANANAPAMPPITLFGPMVRVGGDLTVTFDPQPSVVSPGDDATIPVTVRNLQNVEDTVFLDLGPVGGNALVAEVDPSQAVLAPGDVATFTVTVPTAQDTVAGDHAWLVEASTAAGTTVLASDPLQVHVLQVHEIDLAFGTPLPATAEPGEVLEIPLVFHNTGNGPDTLQLNANTNMPASWTPASFTVPLDPGATAEQVWQIVVPKDASQGQVHLRVQAESSAVPGSKSDPLLHTVTVPAAPHAGMTTTEPTLPVAAGDDVLFPMTLRNDGNAADTFQFSFATDDEIPSQAWTVDAPTQSVTLQPGETATRTVTISAPDVMEPGDRVSVETTLTPTTRPELAATRVVTAMPAFPDLTAAPSGSGPTFTPETLYAGRDGEVHVDVQNVGAGQAGEFAIEVDFRTVRDGTVGASIGTATRTIESLDWRSGANVATVEIPVPLDEIDPDDAPIGLHVTVTVDPDNDVVESTTANNEVELTESVHRFDLRATGPVDVTALAGQAVAWEGDTAFRVRNHGDVAQDLSIRIASDPAWMTPKSIQVTLAAGQAHAEGARIVVPQNAGAEEAVVTFEARNQTSPDLKVETSVTVHVPDTEAPQITSVATDHPVVALGEAIEFSARIQDRLAIHQAKVFAIAPDGTVTNFAMTPTGDGKYNVTGVLDRPGDWTAYVWAQDDATSRNANDTSADPVHFAVRPATAPRVTIVTPSQDSAVRPGTVLVYSVQSTVTLAAAEYRVGNVSSPLHATNPLQISTSGWPEGPTNVTVNVTDAFGAAAEVVHAITIDATAPKVVRITLDPVRPEPGQLVRATADVEDASTISEAVLRLQRVTGSAVDVPLSDEDGVWTAEFEYPSDLDSVVVLAKDAAGNRGYGERTLLSLLAEPQDTDETGGSSPGPSVLLVAGILGLLVIGRRLAERKGGKP